MENGVSKLQKSKGLLKLVATAGALAILVPAGAMAAADAVKVTNDVVVEKIKNPVTAKIKDFDGGKINARNVPKYGAFEAPGSPGALDVWTMKGAFIGLIDNNPGTPCDEEPDPDEGLCPTFTIPAAGGQSYLENLVVMESATMPGTDMQCEIEIKTDAVLAAPETPLPLLEAVITEPTILETPLRLTDDFHIKVSEPGDADPNGASNCSVGIVGFVPSSQL